MSKHKEIAIRCLKELKIYHTVTRYVEKYWDSKNYALHLSLRQQRFKGDKPTLDEILTYAIKHNNVQWGTVSAFVWSKTPEGVLYWLGKNTEFKKLYNEMIVQYEQ